MWTYNYTYNYIRDTNELYHFGIKGMKWGVRRFQKEDGTLTKLGQARKDHNKSYHNAKNKAKAKAEYKQAKHEYKRDKISEKDVRDFRELMATKYSSNKEKRDLYRNMTDEELRDDIVKKQNLKKTIVTTAAVVGLSAAAYIAYRNYSASNLQKKILDGLESNLPESAKESVKKVLTDSLDDVSVVLEPGSKIHRMVGFKDFDLKKAGKRIYASFEPGDVDAYKSLLRDYNRTRERYDVTLEVTKRIKAPTLEKAKEIFDRLYNENPEYKKALSNTLVELHSSFTPGVSKSVIRTTVEKDISSNPFSKGIYAMVRGGADSDMLSKAYRKAGYNAIVDYFDRGSLANTPLILLDPKRTLRKTGESFVTKNDKLDSLFRLFATDHISVKDTPSDVYDAAKRFISEGEREKFNELMEKWWFVPKS